MSTASRKNEPVKKLKSGPEVGGDGLGSLSHEHACTDAMAELERRANEAGFLLIEDSANPDEPDISTCTTGSGLMAPVGPEAVATSLADSTVDGHRRLGDWSGRVIGDYTLVRRIGSGGGGTVYEAIRQQPYKRRVAIKVFAHRHYDNNSRMKVEVGSLARLDHPGIVSVIELIQHDHDQPCLVMSLVEGERIDTWAEKRDATPHKIAGMMLVVARAMEYVHQKSLLHRDLKPSNILVTNDDRAIVTDFGLARFLDADREHSLTETGMTIGSIGFLAPELANAKANSSTAAIDIYGIGATLYRLLTGVPPTRTESWSVCLDDVENRIPIAPRKFNTTIPLELQSICMKCLEKSPAKRYGSMALLAEDLTRFLAGLPVQARPIGRIRRLCRWAKREPVVSSLTVVIALMVLGATITFWFLWQSAEQNRIRLRHNLEMALQILKQEQEEAANHLLVVPGASDYRILRLKSAIEFLKVLVAENPDDPSIRHRLGVAWYLLGQVPKFEERNQERVFAYNNALAVFRELASEFPLTDRYRFDIFHTLLGLGCIDVVDDGGVSRRLHHQEALDIIEKLVIDVPENPDYHDALAAMLIMMLWRFDAPAPDLDGAFESCLRAREIAVKLVRQFPARPQYMKHVYTSTDQLTINARSRGNLAEAILYNREAQNVAKTLIRLIPANPDYRQYLALSYSRAALLAIDSNDLPGAADFQRQALQELGALITDFPDITAYKIMREDFGLWFEAEFSKAAASGQN